MVGTTLEALSSQMEAGMASAQAAAAAATLVARSEELQSQLQRLSSTVAAGKSELEKDLTSMQSTIAESQKFLTEEYQKDAEIMSKEASSLTVELGRRTEDMTHSFTTSSEVLATRTRLVMEEALREAKISLDAFKEAAKHFTSALEVNQAANAAYARETLENIAKSTSLFLQSVESSVHQFEALKFEGFKFEGFQLSSLAVDPSTLTAVVGATLLALFASQGLSDNKDFSYVATKGSQVLAVDANAKKAFTLYCLKFNKKYQSDQEWRQHFQRWRKRAQLIDDYNTNNNLKLALNANADLPGDDGL